MRASDVSGVVVSFQAVGTLLLALIIAQLGRIFVFRYARMWALGWVSISIGLLAVRLYIQTLSRSLWFVYLMGEWLFIALLCIGCYELSHGIRLDKRRLMVVAGIALVLAAILTVSVRQFNDLFVIEAAIMAGGSMASLLILRNESSTTGRRTMRLALLVMFVLYASYVPLYAIHEHRHPLPFLTYSSLADLLANVLLGCSMILVTAEAEKRELNLALAALAEAQGQLEHRLQTDPLTEVLSRHAFHVMQDGHEVATAGVLAGVVVMIDVDNLKSINDEMGHAAGDVVIRAAANALRTLIRADDLLFRWGGDEFVAILPNMTPEAIVERLAPLDSGMTGRAESGFEIPFRVSWGESAFGTERSLDEAIKLADQKMYRSRRE